MEKKIKKILIVLLFSFALAQEEILLDKVSAVVEGKIVLLSDVVLAANALAAQQKISYNFLQPNGAANHPERYYRQGIWV